MPHRTGIVQYEYIKYLAVIYPRTQRYELTFKL